MLAFQFSLDILPCKACLIFVLLIFVTSIYDEERLAYLRSTQPLFLDRQASGRTFGP